jgi:hypothetical protein
MQEVPMFVHLTGSGRRAPRQTASPSPSIDRFGACVSIVVLVAAATAVFVVRQNLDDHVYSLASNTMAGETTGAAVAK